MHHISEDDTVLHLLSSQSCSFLRRSSSPTPWLCRMAPPPLGDIHEALRSISHNPTKNQWPASCLTTRANSPQHKFENCAIFFMRRRKANLSCREKSKARSSVPATFLSRPCASLTPNSCVRARSLLDVTPNNRPPPLTGRSALHGSYS